MNPGPDAPTVLLLAAAGFLVVVGGLVWTGLYGAPHHGPAGFTMFVVGGVATTIVAARAD